MSPWRLRGAIVAMSLVAWLVALEMANWAAERKPQSREEILEAQINLCQQAFQVCATIAGPPPPGDRASVFSPAFVESIVLWSRREAEARSQLGSPANRVAAWRAHRERIQGIVARSESLYRAGRVDAGSLRELEYQVLEADLQLARATEDEKRTKR
jgi:hypothetical protein